MRKQNGKILFCLGSILILLALILVAWNKVREEQSARLSYEANLSIQKLVEQRGQEKNLPTETTQSSWIAGETFEQNHKELPAVEIDGYSYIGTLSLPTLELELPVIDHSTYPGLRRAPCREYGTTAHGMVIAGHNYRKHFGQLKTMTPGDLVKFIDMDGEVTIYEVELVDIIQPGDVHKVLDTKWDLVLYTCTYGGRTRVMVGCHAII